MGLSEALEVGDVQVWADAGTAGSHQEWETVPGRVI